MVSTREADFLNICLSQHIFGHVGHVEFPTSTKKLRRGRRGRDRMVVVFKTTCAINAYSRKTCEFEPRSWRGVFNTLCDKVCQ